MTANAPAEVVQKTTIPRKHLLDLDDFSHDFLFLLEKNFSKDTSSVQINDLF